MAINNLSNNSWKLKYCGNPMLQNDSCFKKNLLASGADKSRILSSIESLYTCPMTPKFGLFCIDHLPHNKKRGYPLSARLQSEAYHSPVCWRTEWYPRTNCWYTRKCAMKAWLAFTHTTGIHVQHSRGIILRIVFDTHLLVVISDCQSTKHRVTLFRYVVPAPQLHPSQRTS